MNENTHFLYRMILILLSKPMIGVIHLVFSLYTGDALSRSVDFHNIGQVTRSHCFVTLLPAPIKKASQQLLMFLLFVPIIEKDFVQHFIPLLFLSFYLIKVFHHDFFSAFAWILPQILSRHIAYTADIKVDKLFISARLNDTFARLFQNIKRVKLPVV